MSHPVQILPPTRSDERMHILDETCWCRPILKDGQLRHASPGVAALRAEVESLRADLHAVGGEAVTND
jgi:hypothetical protein